jgi:mono/diheme cytochrome c family protein
LRWPFNTQWALALWRFLYFSPGEFKATAGQSSEWNRGAYLVQGLGHCSACHAERNALGASRNAAGLQGGLIPMQNWYAPSLASNAQAGVGHWREADIVALLRTGTAPGATVQGPMAEVVRGSTQHLSQADLQAMAVYLKDLPGHTAADKAGGPASTAPAEPPTKAANLPPAGRGAKLYEQHCAQCHGRAGEGVPGAYVPLAGNRAVTLPVATNLAQTVMHGGFAPATAGNPRPYGMPPFLLVLDDADIAAVLSFVRSSWGNSAGPVTELDVGQVRSSTRR